jgi:5'/3'-nucleotidase SurE
MRVLVTNDDGVTGAFGARPDVVVAGINHGHNLGRAVIHSGTVGVADDAGQLGEFVAGCTEAATRNSS